MSQSQEQTKEERKLLKDLEAILAHLWSLTNNEEKVQRPEMKRKKEKTWGGL